MNTPFRGEVWLVALDPTVGAEIKKTRPAVVISNDTNNQYAQTVTILPVSDIGEKVYPFEARLSSKTAGLMKESKVRTQQIRTVDKGRLVKFLGKVTPSEMNIIVQSLLIHLGIEI